VNEGRSQGQNSAGMIITLTMGFALRYSILGYGINLLAAGNYIDVAWQPVNYSMDSLFKHGA